MKKYTVVILLVIALLMLALNTALLIGGLVLANHPLQASIAIGQTETTLPFNVSFSADMVAAGVAGLVSLLFAYFPTLNTWYASLPKDIESLIMIGLMAVTALTIALIQPTFPDWQVFVQTLIIAIWTNASTYIHLPETPAVILAKAKRAATTLANIQ
jgi:hypothetical protein